MAVVRHKVRNLAGGRRPLRRITTRVKTLRWMGIALTVIGIGGFFTAADDLRHRGELMGVGTILLFGLVLLGWSLRRRK